MNDNPEAAQLDLLDPLQQELTDALESLGGKNPNAFADWYFLLSAKHIHRAADGYLALR